MRVPTACACLALSLLAPLGSMLGTGPAGANDTVAHLGAGGLEFATTDAVALEREDLGVSRERVRVAYRFRNVTDAAVELRVAFPLPRLDMQAVFGCSDLNIPFRDRANFLGFETRVDGRAVPLERQERAFVGETDVTGLMRELGVPFTATGGDLTAALARLAPAARERLKRAGALIDETCQDGVDGPLWTAEVVYHRLQRFEPGAVTRVEHSYVPSVGAFFIHLGEKPAGAPGRRHPEYDPDLARYCIDDATWRAMVRLGGGRDLVGRPLEYVLRTARSWRGPIGEFVLTVDSAAGRAAAEAGEGRSLVSLCASGVRKVGPSTFEVRHRDYRPDDDLRVLFVDPPVR